MDFIDSAIFLKDKGLTEKIGAFGQGESGGLTALTSIFQEPYLFESAVVTNPITDLVQHLFLDIETRNTSSGVDHDIRHYDKLQEFGDPQNKVFYEAHKMYSPYHMPTIDETAMNTDLLVCVDEENKHKYHSRKLICKLRG